MTTSSDGPVLLGIDVHGIQSYLFATSKLKEVIGASRIVDDFTGSQADDAPAQTLKALGLSPCTSSVPNGDKWFVPVRLGGGVIRVLVPNENLARQFVRQMSEWVLQHACKLEFDAAWTAFDLKSGSLDTANAQLIARINAQRQQSTCGNAFNGFPFSAPCRLTGDAAEGYDGRNERLCAASLDKRAYQARRDDRWASVKDEPILRAFKLDDPRRPFIFDLESMQGDDPSDSYMAVVALDINSLGELGKKALAGVIGVESLHRMRTFVQTVSDATTDAFSAALNALTENTTSSHEFDVIQRMVNVSRKLPLRPLVFGGDDLTFVMHAALAPRFAVCLASVLDRAGYSSGVGVAIVKRNSPLSRAIDLAEALLSRAKRAGRDKTHLDFMLCSAELPVDPSAREQSAYRPARGPYTLTQFRTLLDNAKTLKHELPSSHVRGAVDGFAQSLSAGRALLHDLRENIDRRLGGGAFASPAARDLVERLIADDALAATYLDCVDLFRFIAPRPDGVRHTQRNTPANEVTT